jgi:hypothetical protein
MTNSSFLAQSQKRKKMNNELQVHHSFSLLLVTSAHWVREYFLYFSLVPFSFKRQLSIALLKSGYEESMSHPVGVRMHLYVKNKQESQYTDIC